MTTHIKHQNIYSLIYTRVSSKSQKKEGSGDASQEVRCLEYSKIKGYIYEKTFEDVFTGGGNFMHRKGMVDLLKYIDAHKDKRFVIIFDDLKRFARDVKFHISLREALAKRNARVESPNFNFEDSPEGEAHELYTAVSNQLERKQNQRQVIQKQTARLTDGYWPFHAPIGYTMRKVDGYGKILFPNENAEVIKAALEGFATMRFAKKLDLALFLKEKGIVRNQPIEKYYKTVTKLLNNPLYAGYVEFSPRGITLRKGKHEALISFETYMAIQKRLKKPDNARARLDIRDDFPIRGFVVCTDCQNKITGGISTGRKQKKYSYYNCCKPNCPMKGKTIKKKDIEDEFAQLLQNKDVTQEIVEYAIAIYDDAWAKEYESRYERIAILTDEITACEDEITSLIDLSYKTQIEIARSQYERRIETLSLRINTLQEEINEKPTDYAVSFRNALDTVFNMLKSPYTVWESWSIDQKQKLFYFLFDGPLNYRKGEGFRNAEYSCGIKALEAVSCAETADVQKDRNTSNHCYISTQIDSKTIYQLREYIYKWYFILQQVSLQPKQIPIGLPIQKAA